MHRFLHQAWIGENGFFRYLATTFAVVLSTFFAGFVAVPLFDLQPTGSGAISPEAFGLDPVSFLAFATMPFVFVFGMLYFCMRVLHRRPFASLVAPDGVDWSRIAVAGGAWAALSLVALGVSTALDPGSVRFVWEPNAFASLLLVAGLLIPIQASAEELLFRGYYLQGFGRLFRSGWGALLVTSVVFGLLHGANAEVAEHGWALAMPFYVGFGVLLGALTLVDNRMELALGVHVANNLFGTVVATSPESSLPTPALLRLQEPALSVESLVGWAVMALAFAGLMAARYGWTWADARDALGRVSPPEVEAPDAEAPEAESSDAEAPEAESPDADPPDPQTSSEDPRVLADEG